MAYRDGYIYHPTFLTLVQWLQYELELKWLNFINYVDKYVVT